MNRRRYLAALAGVGLTGGATWATFGRSPDGNVAVDTVDACGSATGRRRIPVPGTPTLANLFATWCGSREAQMRSLTALHERYGGDAAFVSVTNERVGGDSALANAR